MARCVRPAAALPAPIRAYPRLFFRPMLDLSSALPLALPAHPRTPDAFCVTAAAAWTADGGLRFAFHLAGDLRSLRLPAPAPAARCDGLWQHSCCEAFVAARGAAAYREFNFSPSGAWAAYDFAAYRQPVEGLPAMAAPLIRVEQNDACLLLVASVAAGALPFATDGLDIGLSMVIEANVNAKADEKSAVEITKKIAEESVEEAADEATIKTASNTLSYRALRHCALQPDFHQRDSFALFLPFP